jgi:hypothetical protein
LAEANPQPHVVGLEPLPGKVNYFLGKDPGQWRTGVPIYAKVRYAQVYPGVDLLYYGHQQQVEYDFALAPGADPKAITLLIEGVEALEIDGHGDLMLQTRAGPLRMPKPRIYQERDGVRQAIAGGYLLKGPQRVGFQVGSYDPARPLVIDPVLSYPTYLGGSDADGGSGIAVDRAGSAYVIGTTRSTDFPTANPLDGPSAVAWIPSWRSSLLMAAPSATPPTSAVVTVMWAVALLWIGRGAPM